MKLSPEVQPFAQLSAEAETQLSGQCQQSILTETATITLTFKPDKSVISAAQFQAWLQQATEVDVPTWEALGSMLIEGFYDAALPHYVQLTLNIQHQNQTQQVIQLTQQRPN